MRIVFNAMVIIPLAMTTAFSGPGNFKKGDTWKYAYRSIETQTTYPATSERVMDSTFGMMWFSLDSMVVNNDTAYWFITKKDSLKIHKISPDTQYVFDSVILEKYSVAKGRMHAENFYAVNNHIGRDDSAFFLWSQLPDTSYETRVINGGSQVFRATLSGNAIVDGKNIPFFTRIDTGSYFTLSAMSGASGDWVDTTLWCDSLGLYKRVARSNGSGSIWQIASHTYELYTLLQRNGKTVNLTVGTVNPQLSKAVLPSPFKGRSIRYFDLQGRILTTGSNSLDRRGILVHEQPDGRCGVTSVLH